MTDAPTTAPDQTQETPPTLPEALLARLDALGVEHEDHSHPPLFTVEDSKALRGELPGAHVKNLFLRDKKGKMWLVVCLEDRAIDLKALGAALGGARLSFGSPDRLWKTLGIRPGAVSPLALVNDTENAVTVILDQELMTMAPLNFHPLTNEMTVAITPDGLRRFLKDTGHTATEMDLSPL